MPPPRRSLPTWWYGTGTHVEGTNVVQAVQMLTGLERFVRLVVERESLVPRSSAPSATLNNSADKSPKVGT